VIPILRGASTVVQAAPDTVGVPVLIPGLTPEAEIKILISLAVIGGLVILRRVAMWMVERRVDNTDALYRWSKVTGYAAFLVGLLVIVQIWFTALLSLGTFLGLLTAGLAIALKDLVADMAGWVFILWRKPFELGDRIQLGGTSGDVVDIRVFSFTVLEIGNWVAADQSTGRIIHIPNARVFTEQLANYTASFPFLWNEIPVLVTFESDWRKAKRILREIVDEEAAGLVEDAERRLRASSRRFLIHYSKLTPVVYTSVLDSGVLLTLRYLCHARRRRGTAEAIHERILDAFARHDDVDFAYPTQRVYLNPLEGKEGARAPLPPLSPDPEDP
jgi:small-conductance mechanosensitive channel